MGDLREEHSHDQQPRQRSAHSVGTAIRYHFVAREAEARRRSIRTEPGWRNIEAGVVGDSKGLSRKVVDKLVDLGEEDLVAEPSSLYRCKVVDRGFGDVGH